MGLFSSLPPLVMRYFFLLFLLIPIAGQTYVSLRTWQVLPAILTLRIGVVALMALAFVAFFVAMSGALDRMPMGPATVVYEVGTSWLMILLYLFMTFLLLDILRLCHVLPRALMHSSPLLSAAIAVVMTGLFTLAWLHYESKKRVAITVRTDKAVLRPMQLVLISDIHLGYHNRRGDLHRWLSLIRAEHPDAILIAGDLIDRSYRPVGAQRMHEEFRSLGIPVIACLGNHDYYTGLGPDLRFCRDAGITVLRDSTLSLGGVTVVGRDDRTNPRRKPLSEVMRGVDRSSYIIELDHQPYHLEEAEQCGVDFEFAGHTHYGQVWPINWITDAVYEDAFGPMQKGRTQYYVSSGLGIWGAKFRIGTQSEYIVLTITGPKKQTKI